MDRYRGTGNELLRARPPSRVNEDLAAAALTGSRIRPRKRTSGRSKLQLRRIPTPELLRARPARDLDSNGRGTARGAAPRRPARDVALGSDASPEIAIRFRTEDVHMRDDGHRSVPFAGENLERPEARAAHHGAEAFGRRRLREEKPLEEIDSMPADLEELFRRFHSFRDDARAEPPREKRQGVEQRPPGRIGVTALDEVAVELEEIGPAVEDPPVVRLAEADVVESDANAEAFQGREGAVEIRAEAVGSMLDDFEDHSGGREPVAVRESREKVGEIGLALEGRGVHVERDRRPVPRLRNRTKGRVDTDSVERRPSRPFRRAYSKSTPADSMFVPFGREKDTRRSGLRGNGRSTRSFRRPAETPSRSTSSRASSREDSRRVAQQTEHLALLEDVDSRLRASSSISAWPGATSITVRVAGHARERRRDPQALRTVRRGEAEAADNDFIPVFQRSASASSSSQAQSTRNPRNSKNRRIARFVESSSSTTSIRFSMREQWSKPRAM